MKSNRARLERVIEHQGGTCYFCAVPVSFETTDMRHFATWEHLRPLSRGGTNHPDNLVAACMRCNQRKASMLEKEYYAFLAAQEDADG